MTEPKASRRIDARSLRGLAHPLRMRILETLSAHGPATSARLAARLGENTGTISWHLRHLAEHGFIEEELGRGTRRERWWRRARSENVINVADFAGDQATQVLISGYLREMLQRQFQRVADSLAAPWEGEWLGAGSVSEWNNLRLTPAQLQALNADLAEVVARHTPAEGAEPDPAARSVVVQIQAVPRAEDLAAGGAVAEGTRAVGTGADGSGAEDAEGAGAEGTDA